MYDLYRMSATPNPMTILKIDEVLRRTGLKTTGLYERIKEGTFPAQVSLGARAVGWYEHQVQDWIGERPAVESRRRQNADGINGALSDERGEHAPVNGTKKDLASTADSACDDAPDHARKHKAGRRSTTGTPICGQDMVAATSDASKTEELERLRFENSRLKILIANLMLENDALRSATAGIPAA